MSTTLYIEQENGNLKLVAEVEDIDNAGLAVDALLDNSKIRDREFVAVIGSLENGQVVRVTVEDDAPVMPRRAMTISFNGTTEVAEQPKVTPRRQSSKPAQRTAGGGRRKSSTRKPAAKKGTTARKPAASKTSTARKSGGRSRAAKPAAAKASAGKKASPFKTRGDDE